MRHGLAKLLRQGHRLAEKRRYRRRGNNEQPNFQNVRLSFSSTTFVLIWSLQLAGRRFWGSRFEARISKHWQLDCQSGEAPDFSGKDPLGSLFVCPTSGVSPNRRFQFQKSRQFFIGMHNKAPSAVAVHRRAVRDLRRSHPERTSRLSESMRDRRRRRFQDLDLRNWLDAAGFKAFPAPMVRSNLNYRHWSAGRIGMNGCEIKRYR
jgi:hypothetical protein